MDGSKCTSLSRAGERSRVRVRAGQWVWCRVVWEMLKNQKTFSLCGCRVRGRDDVTPPRWLVSPQSPCVITKTYVVVVVLSSVVTVGGAACGWCMQASLPHAHHLIDDFTADFRLVSEPDSDGVASDVDNSVTAAPEDESHTITPSSPVRSPVQSVHQDGGGVTPDLDRADASPSPSPSPHHDMTPSPARSTPADGDAHAESVPDMPPDDTTTGGNDDINNDCDEGDAHDGSDHNLSSDVDMERQRSPVHSIAHSNDGDYLNGGGDGDAGSNCVPFGSDHNDSGGAAVNSAHHRAGQSPDRAPSTQFVSVSQATQADASVGSTASHAQQQRSTSQAAVLRSPLSAPAASAAAMPLEQQVPSQEQPHEHAAASNSSTSLDGTESAAAQRGGARPNTDAVAAACSTVDDTVPTVPVTGKQDSDATEGNKPLPSVACVGGRWLASICASAALFRVFH